MYRTHLLTCLKSMTPEECYERKVRILASMFLMHILCPIFVCNYYMPSSNSLFCGYEVIISSL